MSKRMKKTPKTPSIKISTTWDLNKLFKNDDDPGIEEDIKPLSRRVTLSSINGKTGKTTLKNPKYCGRRLMNMKHGRGLMELTAMPDIISGFAPRLTATILNSRPDSTRSRSSAANLKMIYSFFI